MTLNELTLAGCRPTPLANYLKALGVLRLVSQQLDPQCRGYWKNDEFVLQTQKTAAELVGFFANEYAPTPVIAPWNGGSGFYEKDNQQAVSAIAQSQSGRFAPYRATILAAKQVILALDVGAELDKSRKEELLIGCRAHLPDEALDWLDAAVVLTTDGPKYPALLGTGGNDGRLEFTNNFMQRITALISPQTGSATVQSADFARNALFDTLSDGGESFAIGQFSPGAAGGANLTSGFDADASANPWNFVLMIEGAVTFAAAAARRLELGESALVAPFALRPSAVGYASSSDADVGATRSELWAPLWHAPARYDEVSATFREGRIRDGDRGAQSGLDAIQALARLGSDRGINAFQRYAFQERNGLAYLAVPLNRIEVQRNPEADALDEIDDYVRSFRRAGTGENAPASMRRANRRLEAALWEFSRNPSRDHRRALLEQLGECESVSARSPKGREARPMPRLNSSWISAADDRSLEFQLACGLASMRSRVPDKEAHHALRLRNYLVPVAEFADGNAKWSVENSEKDLNVVWTQGAVLGSMLKLLRRRAITGAKNAPLCSDVGVAVPLPAIAAFIRHEVDEARLERLLFGLAACDFSGFVPPVGDGSVSAGAVPDGLYALLKLCFSVLDGAPARQIPPLRPAQDREILTLGAAGDGLRASRAAARRLRASGCPARVSEINVSGEAVRRASAALLFPVSMRDTERLLRQAIRSATLEDLQEGAQ